MHKGLNGNQSINDQGAYDFPHSLYRQLDLMKAAGATWVRLNFRLGAYYQNWSDPGADGSFALAKYDQVVARATSLGLNILGLASPETWRGSQASWQENNAGTGLNPYITAFANAVSLLASRYPQIALWEIWNEPNVWTRSVAQGGSYIYPSNFAAMLDTVAKAVPGVLLVSGGITSFDWDTGATYLNATFGQGKTNFGWRDWPVAYVGQHLYIRQGGVVVQSDLTQNFFRTTKPILITEVGWQTSNVSEQVQAANLLTTYATAAAAGNIAGVSWFSVQDAPEASLYFGLQTGGLQSDNYVGTPKASFSTFQGVGRVPLPAAYTGNAKKTLDNEWNAIGDLNSTTVPRSAIPMDGDYAQVHAEWLTLKLTKGHNILSPVTTFINSSDWNGVPIKLMLFLNARAEYTPLTGGIRWWNENAEITLGR